MDKFSELLERLQVTDECVNIEAKKGSSIDKSVMETICSFSNEPSVGGGYIILGIERGDHVLIPNYDIIGIENPDKLQADLASQCASYFNQPVRPQIELEENTGKLIMKIFVPELPDSQKPLYIKKEGLPKGAYRRIGSTDQRCTEEDMYVFYNTTGTLDSTIIADSSLEDVSEEALELYRSLRSKVSPYAEELQYSDKDLLQSLNCARKEDGKWFLTYAGLIVFGSRKALRRLLPMVRVDYIRVPGNEWVANPDNRFKTIDMRGSLLELVQRTFSAISDDLPNEFLLEEGKLQAESIGLPSKVLREAIVNAFMHRTYLENQPIQIIRYSNRIEIKNPGFSLKPADQLGEPGSKNRNPVIAAIFHETNLAETKGSGIRTMRSLMEKANMAPPTFESNHGANLFTTILLLHHFLNEADIEWLDKFKELDLSDGQKRALIFIRETGVIDNSFYRQIIGCDIIKASNELRALRDKGLINQQGRGRSTYYLPSELLDRHGLKPSLSQQMLFDLPYDIVETTEPSTLITEPLLETTEPNDQTSEPLVEELPELIKKMVFALGKKSSKEEMNKVILLLCMQRPYSQEELSRILKRDKNHLYREYIKPLRDEGKLQYTIPDMPNHPNQSYKAFSSEI